ncbi:RNA-binding S4 domain-containing protein [Sphingomonas prati]|uniref:Ribosomal 50S subunit-recycling heat shock protein n=1 Tax=Sphingomonas prati TaxID=1843237 RepID=A0A7W9F2C0_9SPHN|nr:RNA-binding S4 domain-containing protein [Sphingomonas prati]MBB5730233.1 ribosomal 50S subunit-recycling heat shock protein [Sphingomonas prati]GGE92571.1 RNA-binding protein S4 [Sphingomonas prati]
MPDGGLRLDKYLCYVRMAKTRSLAADLAAEGHLRIDGRTVARAHAPVRIGNVLSFALHGRVRILRVEAIPVRRGSPTEARACYTDLSPPPVVAAGNPTPEIAPVDAPETVPDIMSPYASLPTAKPAIG